MGKHLSNKAFSGDDKIDPVVASEQACAIKRVLDPQTRRVVGWLYQWGTGDLSVMWKDERFENVIYE